MLASKDIDLIKQRIKENARRIFEDGTDFPKSRSKIAIMRPEETAEDADQTNDLEQVHRSQKSYDFGILITDPRIIPEFVDVLDAKRLFYSALCQKNEEIKRIEQELLEIDPTRAGSVRQQMEQTTISRVFGEHEIISFMQLRDIRNRELRSILLHQLNFFRSVQRKLEFDVWFI